MTIEQGKAKVVSVARAEVGYHEGANNYVKYSDDPLIERLYGWKPQNQPWCGTFVNWCFLTAFGYSIGSKLTYGGSAACKNAADYYKANNAFVRQPQLGDQAFFYSNGGINHTGIVVVVDNSAFYSVEGNYTDKVSLVRHNVYGSDVAGFGRPNWKLVQENELTDGKETVSTEKPDKLNLEDHSLILPVLRYGSKGVAVKLWQTLLTMRNFPCGEIDGDFGALTQAATNRLQEWAEISVDGVVGNESWTASLKGDSKNE